MDYDNAKRLKSSSGAPISMPRGGAGAGGTAANIPQYQPPPARTSPSSQPSTASLSRPAAGSKQSLKLTVKAAPSKLRQATSGSAIPPNPYAEADESDATPQPATRTARSTRNPRTVVEPDSDEDEDMDAEGEEDEEEAEEDGEEVDQELLANEDSEDDAAGSEDEMDELSADHPPPPIIRQEKVPGKAKPNVTVTAPGEGPLKSVEAKEIDDADDDELSDLESDNENEIGNDIGEDEDEEMGDEDDSDIDNSRSATPDLSKLTRRQRGAFEEDANLMALSNEAQTKKQLSAEEHAMRRQEMARRRKNLSEKRNEEEKMDTINKLLKKPAPKRRTRAEMIAAAAAAEAGTPGADGEDEPPRADPLYSRWISNKEGSRLAVPDEWLEGPLGEMFRSANGQAVNIATGGSGKMVEEVA